MGLLCMEFKKFSSLKSYFIDFCYLSFISKFQSYHHVNDLSLEQLHVIGRVNTTRKVSLV